MRKVLYMNYFYYYKVVYYDGNEKIVAEGVTFGENWMEVMHHLVQQYGEDEMTEILHLKILGDGGDCLPFDEIPISILDGFLKQYKGENND